MDTSSTSTATAPIAMPTTGSHIDIAHKEWASRPADQRFESVFALAKFLVDRQKNTKEAMKPFSEITVESHGEDVRIRTTAGFANLTHHSFTQLAGHAGLRAAGLRSSFEAFRSTAEAAKWVADGLNLGLQGRDGSSSAIANLLVTANGGELTARSINTEQYARVWDLELIQQILIPLEEHGFVNPPAYDGPGGLYASDRDMFALMVPRNVRRINMPGVTCDVCREPFEINGQLFSPFNYLSNSEVGGASLLYGSGLLQGVCANLNIWGAMGHSEIRITHKGEPLKRLLEEFQGFMTRWVRQDSTAEENVIRAAMNCFVAAKVEDVSALVYNATNLTKAVVSEAIATVEKGDMSTGIISQDPTLLWNLVAAITANARPLPNQDDRMQQVREAGKLMELVRN
jgi:hypothetical protein